MAKLFVISYQYHLFKLTIILSDKIENNVDM